MPFMLDAALMCIAAIYDLLIGVNIRSLKGGKVVACLQFIVAGCGLFFASRQLWLQSLPAGQAPSCMPGLDVLIRYFPWQDVVHSLLWGTGDCAEISWQWLGLSMPAWAALYFLFLLVVAIPVFWMLRRQLLRLEQR